MASINRTRRIVISTVVLAAASAGTGMAMLVSGPTASALAGTNRSDSTPAPTGATDMPGMDMGGMDMGGSTPAPQTSMAPDMPGMDMGGSTPAPTSSGDMPGMDMPGMDHGHDGAEVAVNRPVAPVLGTFGGGSAAVLLTAGMLRRKDRAASLAKQTARRAGGAGK